ncbi:MAG: RNA polymerase sigma factor [Clostridia bacterium]|nr:RNA polymerase sigma factor [Clostridia bacterium]
MDNGASSYRRFLNGDETALIELVKEYRPGLQAYINSIVKNFAVAEDITEETFVKILVKKPKDKGISSFKTWLYTIGRNLAIDWLRRNPYGRYIPFEKLENLQNEEQRFEEQYFREERKLAVHRALESINPDYRQVLILSYFEEFSVEEISKIIKKTKRNTSVILHRAKKALKTQLEKENFNYEI